MNIVWFKRDLRTHDHEALALAAKNGDVLPLYILEPDLWKQPDVSYRHFQYLRHYLSQLEAMFEKAGCKLVIKVGDAWFSS